MRYKGQYRPSELACPVTYKWVPLDLCIPLLDQNKVARLSAALGEEAEERRPVLGAEAVRMEDSERSVSDAVVGGIAAFEGGRVVALKKRRDAFPDAKRLYQLVGPEIMKQLLLVV
ncbi:Arginyl-tRNA--protein transferase 1 [Dinochytrium kinnereticum]|nr:Arginyl-tRNA--protein transferase 1 [Dinochytrium kinnereticum]